MSHRRKLTLVLSARNAGESRRLLEQVVSTFDPSDIEMHISDASPDLDHSAEERIDEQTEAQVLEQVAGDLEARNDNPDSDLKGKSIDAVKKSAKETIKSGWTEGVKVSAKLIAERFWDFFT